jgi:ADP-ribose pyrophosphatase
MPLGAWKRIRLISEKKNPWWAYRHDEVRLPNGKRGEYHYVHVNGSSMVIPLTGAGDVIMVNQFRYLCNRESVEFPCGSVKDGSTYDETARLELAEETGYSAGRMIPAGEFNPYNGVTDEMCHIYVAVGLTPVHAERDETEEFEIVRCTADGVDRKIADGELWDGMSLAAWMLAAPTVRRIAENGL